MSIDSSENPRAKKVCISTNQFPNAIRDEHGNDTYQCLLAVREALAEAGITDATNIVAGGMQIWVEPGQEETIVRVLSQFGITSVSDATDAQKIGHYGLDGAAAKNPLGFAGRIVSIIRAGMN
jgi:hypothetical protein